MLRFIKNHKIIFEQQPVAHAIIVFRIASRRFACSFVVERHREVRKKERVVQHQHIGAEKTSAGFLEKTFAVQRCRVTSAPAKLGRAKAAFGADRLPHFGIRLHLEAGQAAVLRFRRPFRNALEFRLFRRGE